MLALVSRPGFDPNSLDEDWEALVAADGQPFFNRALQGNYQLGGAMYTILLTQVISSRFDLSQRFAQANAAIEVDDGLTMDCVIAPDATELTLLDAYAYGCPLPFQQYFLAAPQLDLDAVLQRFAFDKPITLSGFPQPEPIVSPLAPPADGLDDEALELRAALGQGDLTTAPLHMAAIMAAVATDGRIRAPSIQTASRPPGAQQWQTVSADAATIPVLSAEVAAELRAVMRRAWSALGKDSAGGDIGAQIATSQSGEDEQVWFNGFRESADGAALAFAIVLEGKDDRSGLIAIGQSLIQALALR